MSDSQRRSNSEIGRFFNEFNEPLVLEVSEKVSQLLRFWLTYAQTQQLKIENIAILMRIIDLCVRGYRSIDIAGELTVIGIIVPAEFIDRIYIRIKRLMLIILQDDYLDLGLVDDDFELSDEEDRIYSIYKEFTHLPIRISRLNAFDPKFAELSTYNPFYIDFLMLYSSGVNVPKTLEKDGLELTQAKRFSITESIISVLVRKNFTKTLYKEAQAWTILSMFPVLVDSEHFVKVLRRAFLMYLEGNSTDMQRVTEVRRFLEFIVVFLFPREISIANLDEMTVKQRNARIRMFIEDDSRLIIIGQTLQNLVWHYSKKGNYDDFVSAVQNPAMSYTKRYIESTFSAAISVIFGSLLVTMHTKPESLTDEEFKQWISRNRNSECSAILKIIAGVEA